MAAGIQLAREISADRPPRINWTRILVILTALAMLFGQIKAYGRLEQKVDDLHEQMQEIRMLVLHERGTR